MPKLIDADKLLEWIEGAIKEMPQNMQSDENKAKYRTLKLIRNLTNAGTFDPTPPVQPDTFLTLYKCPQCEDMNVANAWNMATAANYGAQEITRIDEPGCVEASFTCPSCGSEEDYGLLEVIKDEPNT
jgi:predicted RNA-binding Zn-ribbon protein involved in translation (DUF1610 family)